MIYFVTKAWNAEKTLRRAVESILAQTHGDFRYHLCDNASSDGTGDIVREYAKLDRRVIPCFNERNNVWTDESLRKIRNLVRYLECEDWYSVLDADDDYSPDFLEEMLGFAQAGDLDYVACRSDFIDEASGRSMNEYILEKDMIIAGEDFGGLFPVYFRFMGALWGKLQKGSIFQRIDFAALDIWGDGTGLSHRGDTAAMLWFLRYSKRAGVRARVLHNYRHYPVSHSNQNIEGKMRDNHKMPDIYRDFLNAKVGYVSAENESFIQEVFERSMRRTLMEAGKPHSLSEQESK